MQGIIIAPEGGEGAIMPASDDAKTETITFGHPTKKYFGFAQEYVNLNCGPSRSNSLSLHLPI